MQFNKLKNTFFFFIFLFSFTASQANDKYWVFFTDKNGVDFDPYTFFDRKAIERRLKNGLSLYDPTDLPVNENYIASVKELSDSVSWPSRWFNALAVYASQEQVAEIKKLPFVKDVKMMFANPFYIASSAEQTRDDQQKLTAMDWLILKNQTAVMQADKFEKDSIDGKGIRIAVLDAGFFSVDYSPAFSHLRKEDRILKTYNFIKNREDVYGWESHGTEVLSCIAGWMDGYKTGMATGAEFLLGITEDATGEFFSDEENWLAGLEWADRNGAMIVSSSLGHSWFRYFFEEMNGKVSLVSQSANMAARKGMLVLTAAGNEGDRKWKYVLTPADADSALTIGGIEYITGIHIPFSSYGPTSDKRMKPNLCAFGEAIVISEYSMKYSTGTSFATPLVAGFAACAWQIDTSMTNMELFHQLQRSGSLYPYFDYAHGYGIPQAGFFTDTDRAPADTTFDFTVENGIVKVQVRDWCLSDKSCDLKSVLYCHIENASGVLDDYWVYSVEKKNVVQFYVSDYKQGMKLRVHFRGYTGVYEF
ncbi:MAG: S8 family serine peptidase [Bacteroidota bacterium]